MGTKHLSMEIEKLFFQPKQIINSAVNKTNLDRESMQGREITILNNSSQKNN